MVVPHDPRKSRVTVEQMEEALTEIQSQPSSSLEDLAEQLKAEHRLLSRALQGEEL